MESKDNQRVSKEEFEKVAKSMRKRMAKNKDVSKYKPKGNIDFVIDFSVFESDEYKRHLAMVGRNPLGHTINQRVVYTPQLAFILTQNLTGFDRVLNERIEQKSNLDFFKIYSEAYYKGFEYFKTEYLQTDVYLMPQLEFWVKKIYRLYNHDGVYRFGGVSNGWNFVKKKYPLIITNEVLHEYGFYSGLCASAEKFNHENKEIFEAYEISIEPKKVENVEPEKSELEIKFEQHFERLFKGIDQYPINRIVDFELTNLKNGLEAYFIEGKKPVSKVVFAKPNKKAICYNLGQLFEAMNNSKKVTTEYHKFCIDLIPFLNDTRFEKFAKYSIETTNF